VSERRNVMKKFRVRELSGCYSPIQEPALGVLLKAEAPVHMPAAELDGAMADERRALAKSGVALPDGSFPVRGEADLAEGLVSFGKAKDKQVAVRHLAARAEILGIGNLLPKDGEFRTVMEKASALSGGPQENAVDLETLKRQFDELSAKYAKSEADNASHRALDALPDAERSFAKALPDAERDAFVKAEPAARAARLKAAGDTDPIVYTDLAGVPYRKSEGEKAVTNAKRMDSMAKAFAEQSSALERATFEKRANDELPKCPGTIGAKVALLKAVDSIADAADRDAAKAILKAGNDAIALGAKVRGANGPAAPAAGSPMARLTEIASGLRKADPTLTEAQAFAKASRTPEGEELFTSAALHQNES
jgi:hypothetical protein